MRSKLPFFPSPFSQHQAPSDDNLGVLWGGKCLGQPSEDTSVLPQMRSGVGAPSDFTHSPKKIFIEHLLCVGDYAEDTAGARGEWGEMGTKPPVFIKLILSY